MIVFLTVQSINVNLTNMYSTMKAPINVKTAQLDANYVLLIKRQIKVLYARVVKLGISLTLISHYASQVVNLGFTITLIKKNVYYVIPDAIHVHY